MDFKEMLIKIIEVGEQTPDMNSNEVLRKSLKVRRVELNMISNEL